MAEFINDDFPRHSCESCSYWTSFFTVCKNPRSLNYNDITRYDHGCALWEPSSSAKLSDGSVPSVMSDPSVKFTGDNWNLHEYDSCIILRDGKNMVCRCSKNENGRKYAKFIKTAPEMFTALMEVLNWYNAFTPQATGRMFVPDDMIEKVLKAIQKARGEKP